MDAARRRELQEALSRLADGNRAAFRPVFELAWPVVRAFASAALRGLPEADDAAQAALLRVFARASAFDPHREALPWLLGIVANECRSVRRRTGRRREEPLESAAAAAATEPSPEERLIREDLRRAVMEVMAALPERDVDALVASVCDERPRGLAAAAFRKRLERARRRLRQAWRARHGTC